MRVPFDWVKRIVGQSGSAGQAGPSRRRDVLALLTPEAARGQARVVRVVVAGVTVTALVMAGTLAVVSLAGLMAAMAIVYFLSTQVLGLQINVDPTALYQQVKRQAATAASYGPN